MNQTNFDIIELDKNYSTTRRVVKADSQEIAGLVKQANKPEDKFETVLFLPEGENRQGEGGLRTQGYFKTGGIIPSPLTPNPSSEAKPLITVVTVVFNGEKFLEETILSVINQTYDNVEYIIIDGGSTDGTLDIIKKYEHAIDYWVSEKDEGIYDAMNKGLYLSMGGWVNFMNADDYLFDTFVLESIGFKEVYYNNSIIYGAMLLTDEEKSLVTKVENEPQNVINKINKYLLVPHQSQFCNLFLVKKVGSFDLKFKISSDYDLTIRLLKIGGLKFVQNLTVSVMRTGGLSTDLKNAIKIVKEYELIQKKNGIFKYGFYNLKIRFYILLKIVLIYIIGNDLYGRLKRCVKMY